MWVEAINNATDKIVLERTGFRCGTRHILALWASGARAYRAAARDNAGVWSEMSDLVNLTLSPFVAGATEASIGSAAAANADVQDPGIVFPDMAKGSSRVRAFRTLVSKGFQDEARFPQWRRGRAVFNVIYDALDADQAKLLHRLYRTVNGPKDVFLFDWYPPERGTRTTAPAERYLVKFRDALPAGFFNASGFETQFSLVEAMDEPEGGDV